MKEHSEEHGAAVGVAHTAAGVAVNASPGGGSGNAALGETGIFRAMDVD